MIENERLVKWKMLCEQATDGPWVWMQDDQRTPVENWDAVKGDAILLTEWEQPTKFGSLPELVTYVPDGFDNHADARFTAESRLAVPLLIDEVERLQKEIEYLKSEASK